MASNGYETPELQAVSVQIVSNLNDNTNGKQPTVESVLLSPQQKNSQKVEKTKPEGKATKRGLVRLIFLWRTFADYTTLHGFRQIAEDTDYVIRKIFWIIITIFAFGLLLYQMGNSITLYLSRPVAFNVKRAYYPRLDFPAVTICNQNVFRITQAWGEHLYAFLERMYDGKTTNASQLSGVNESLIQVLDKMKHEKEDLILSCTWNTASKCYANELKKTYVDNSICYTYNGNSSNVKSTSLTGSSTGLNVLMNIEQYEFMRTRSLTAGIQVFVHDQHNIPRDAISVPPGMKAYIRLYTKHVKLLSSPYGVCDSKPLSFFKVYSTAACLIECREKWLMKQCKCHSGILPGDHNISHPVCSIRQYSNCVIPKLGHYTPAIGKCDCPTQCNFRRYSSFISFSQISTFDVDQALKHLPKNTNMRLVKAREVFYQVNGDKRFLTLNKTLIPFVNITKLLHGRMNLLQNRVTKLRDELETLKTEIYNRFSFHKYMLERMAYSVKNNWQRGWQVARERTFSLVAFDYLPLLYSIELFEQMHDNPNVTEDMLGNYQSILDTRLFEKEQIALRALSNMSKIHDAFNNTNQLLTFVVTPGRYYDKDFSPETIITGKAKDERKYYARFTTYTNVLIEQLRKMRQYIAVLRYKGKSVNITEFHEAKYWIEKRSRSFNYYLYLYEDRIVKTATERMNDRVSNFVAANKTFFEAFSKLSYKLTNLLSIIKNLHEQFKRSGRIVVDMAEKYIKQRASLETNLTAISTFISRGPAGKMLESFVSGLDSIEVYRLTLKQDIWMLKRAVIGGASAVWDDSLTRPYRRYAQDMHTLCRLGASSSKKIDVSEAALRAVYNRTEVSVKQFDKMRKSAFKMAKKSHGNITCNSVLSVTNSDWILEGRVPVISRLKRKLTAMSDTVLLIKQMTSLKEEMALNVMNVKMFTTKFLEGNKISRKFVRDNFVELQIYYEDLVSVDESQSPAYTMTQLWSDFGGNFGLLLGASALSVIEMVDFLIHENLKMKT